MPSQGHLPSENSVVAYAVYALFARQDSAQTLLGHRWTADHVQQALAALPSDLSPVDTANRLLDTDPVQWMLDLLLELPLTCRHGLQKERLRALALSYAKESFARVQMLVLNIDKQILPVKCNLGAGTGMKKEFFMNPFEDIAGLSNSITSGFEVGGRGWYRFYLFQHALNFCNPIFT